MLLKREQHICFFKKIKRILFINFSKIKEPARKIHDSGEIIIIYIDIGINKYIQLKILRPMFSEKNNYTPFWVLVFFLRSNFSKKWHITWKINSAKFLSLLRIKKIFNSQDDKSDSLFRTINLFELIFLRFKFIVTSIVIVTYFKQYILYWPGYYMNAYYILYNCMYWNLKAVKSNK